MRSRGPILALALLAAPALLAAQGNSQCTPYAAYAQSENLCNAAVDASHYIQPQLGLAISGGNPMVGSFRPLGGLGHFSIGVRATAFQTATPDFSYNGTGPVPAGDSIPLGAPTIDAAIGITRGMPSGLLAVDLLGSVVAIPNDVKDLHVDPSAPTMGNFSYKVGFGARVGILRGSFPIPSITASWMHRQIPMVTLGDTAAGDNYSYQLEIKATNLRVMAGWHLLFLDVGGGLGRDHYTGDSKIFFDDPDPGSPGIKTVPVPLDATRTTIFADVGMNLLFLKIGGEIGKQMDNNLNTVSDFQGIDVKKGLTYASANVRFSF